MGMTRVHTIELSSSDSAALCTIFIDGSIAGVGYGSVAAAVRPGQHVRWFVRSRRRAARFTVLEIRGAHERLVAEGRCEARLGLGEHVASRGRAPRRATLAGSRRAPVVRAIRAAARTVTAQAKPELA